jgi:Acyl-CoA carboxylase epsilon subunit
VTSPDDAGTAADRAQPTPVALTVMHGNPTPEELAALLTIVATASGDDPPPQARSRWGRPMLRGPHHSEPGAWRASALPR